jgi:hypothetical protein
MKRTSFAEIKLNGRLKIAYNNFIENGLFFQGLNIKKVLQIPIKTGTA